MTLAVPELDAPLLLELFNGGEMLLEGVFILWAVRYLWLEAKRRDLELTDWWTLPPSMGFIVAVLVKDFSDFLRAIVIWTWRRFYHAGELADWQTALLLISVAIAIIGGLCKIRSVTKPDHGNEPWLICLALVLVFIVASIAARVAFPG